MTRRRRERRAVVVTVVLLTFATAVLVASLVLGDVDVSAGDSLAAPFGGGSAEARYVVANLRLPRAVAGLVVGAAFGLSGALLQRLAGNPLASPDVIGVNAGAAAAAVTVIVVFHGTPDVVTLGALGGGLAAGVLVHLLARGAGSAGLRLVLVGIGVTAGAAALTSYLLTSSDVTEAQRAAVWLTGSLNGRGWEQVPAVAVALAVLVPAAVLLARPLRLLELGDDGARLLGASVERSRAAILAVSCLLAAVATAAAGPIGFVALAAPQIAAGLLRGRSIALLPAAACGALLLIASDLLARRVVAPTELPAGVVTGLLGGPYLLWLLSRTARAGAR